MDKLHNDTLDLAESLLNGESFGSASLRRAISSAYYSVFQRLSSLCASRLSGPNQGSEEYQRLYRALDHRQVRTALNKSIFSSELGFRFALLQDARQWADYSIAPHPESTKSTVGVGISPSEALIIISKAREALQFVESLDAAAQLKLAVLLIVRDR